MWAVFTILLLFSGCSRDKALRAEKMPETVTVPETSARSPAPGEKSLPAAVPASAGKSQSGVSEVREVRDPAFYAQGDSRGPGSSAAEVRDYELGVLENNIPPAIPAVLAQAGGELPDDSVSPPWKDHMARQSMMFSAGGGTVRLGRILLQNRKLIAPYKLIRDNQVITGSVRAEPDEEGRYLVEDITLEETFPRSLPDMQFPPPAEISQHWMTENLGK